MSETVIWIAYLCVFFATLALGFANKRRLWLISIVTAALSSVALAVVAIWSGADPSDPWLPVGLMINFGMSWVAAAAAIYIVKLVRA